MITLARKLKRDPTGTDSNSTSQNAKRISVRDRLLVKEVQEMEQTLPQTCKVYFNDPNILCEFNIIVSPDEGYWKGGKFKFSAFVPEEYNMAVCINLMN